MKWISGASLASAVATAHLILNSEERPHHSYAARVAHKKARDAADHGDDYGETVPVPNGAPVAAGSIPIPDDAPRDVTHDFMLRFCNAYPHDHPLEMYIEGLWIGAFPFKHCEDIPVKLIAGTRIQFTLKAQSAGEFQVSNLPDNDAYLLLVVKRKDSRGNSVQFLSHTYRPRSTTVKTDVPHVAESQLVLIDAFTGIKSGRPEPLMMIEDSSATPLGIQRHGRKEKVDFDRVSELHPGVYMLDLIDSPTLKIEKEFVVAPGVPYVAIRMGSDDELGLGQAAPSDLIIYPNSHVSMLDRFFTGWAAEPWNMSKIFLYLVAGIVVAIIFSGIVHLTKQYSTGHRPVGTRPPTSEALPPQES